MRIGNCERELFANRKETRERERKGIKFGKKKLHQKPISFYQLEEVVDLS